MARPSGLHDTSHPEREKRIRCENAEFQKKMAESMKLEVGKEYTLYFPFQNAGQIGVTAISKKRTLVGHYQRFARFRTRNGTYETLLYPELAKALRKPGGNIRIITEQESWLMGVGTSAKR